jgi:hypothetical protein
LGWGGDLALPVNTATETIGIFVDAVEEVMQVLLVSFRKFKVGNLQNPILLPGDDKGLRRRPGVRLTALLFRRRRWGRKEGRTREASFKRREISEGVTVCPCVCREERCVGGRVGNGTGLKGERCAE